MISLRAITPTFLRPLVTVEIEETFALPEELTDVIGARVRYYQTEKNTNGVPRVEAIGTIKEIKRQWRTVRVQIAPDDTRLLTKWHNAQDAIISRVWIKAVRQ